MDYCPPCRRHLNGALSCPGCGRSYAEPAPFEPESDDPETGEALAHDTDADPEEREGLPPRTGGRAADRRRKRARKPVRLGRARRARRGRGRRVTILASVLGLVLAGGLVAELASDGGVFHEPPAKPPAKGPVAERTPGSGDNVEPIDDGESVRPSPGTSADADGDAEDGKGKGGDDPSESPSDDESSSDPSDGGSPGGGSHSSRPPSDPSDPDPTPTADDPEPTPSPSETCKHILWWCS